MAELVVERFFSPEYPELLREIATELYLQLGELADTKVLGDERLAEIAYRITEHVRHELGGTNLYLPRGVLHECSARDQEIFSKFRGSGSYKLLADEYDLTEMRIRQIIARCIRAELKKRQGDLFSAKIAESGKQPL